MVSCSLYFRGMAFAEKRAWIMLVVSTIVYGAYITIILRRAGGVPLAHVPYVSTLVWTAVISVTATIVLNIAAAVGLPRGEDKPDRRDREIHRAAEYIGQSFVIAGATAAFLMALAEVDYFWIANAVYLGFVLSAVLSSIAKIFAYRKGFPW